MQCQPQAYRLVLTKTNQFFILDPTAHASVHVFVLPWLSVSPRADLLSVQCGSIHQGGVHGRAVTRAALFTSWVSSPSLATTAPTALTCLKDFSYNKQPNQHIKYSWRVWPPIKPYPDHRNCSRLSACHLGPCIRLTLDWCLFITGFHKLYHINYGYFGHIRFNQFVACSYIFLSISFSARSFQFHCWPWMVFSLTSTRLKDSPNSHLSKIYFTCLQFQTT